METRVRIPLGLPAIKVQLRALPTLDEPKSLTFANILANIVDRARPMSGAGMGLMLGQANTDAINRASRFSFGEATCITQTVRNYGASAGFAILGTLLISVFRSRITSSLVAKGVPHRAAAALASKIAELQGGSGNVTAIPPFIRADFADATRVVLYGMAVIMGLAALVALRGLERGVQRETDAAALDDRLVDH